MSYLRLFYTSSLQGKDDYLGRCVFYPKVRLKGVESPEARLLWQKVKRGDQDGGEVLVDAELFLVSNLNVELHVLFLLCIVPPDLFIASVHVLCFRQRILW